MKISNLKIILEIEPYSIFDSRLINFLNHVKNYPIECKVQLDDKTDLNLITFIGKVRSIEKNNLS